MKAELMWKALWQKWTIDKPAILGDWLWNVFVVQLAAFLNRLTLRQTITLISAIILFLAYYHGVSLSPALLFVGDLVAYVDMFGVLFLLGMLSRATTILLVIKAMAARAGRLANGLVTEAQRLGVRHRRERGTRTQKRLTGRSRNDDEPIIVGGFAWA
jgi:hypothetical protein